MRLSANLVVSASSNKTFLLLQELVEYIDKDDRSCRYNWKAWVKISAPAGLGNKLSRLTGLKYEIGIWRFNMVQELAWGAGFTILGTEQSVVPQAARLPQAPSWSWASMNQKLHFRPGRHAYPCKEMVQVEDLIKLHTSAPNNGPVQWRLRVRGRLGQLMIRKTKRKIAVSWEQVYHPTRYTFGPVREVSDSYRHNEKCEVALIDTLADTMPGRGLDHVPSVGNLGRP